MSTDHTPRFELQRVFSDSSADEPEVSPLLFVPTQTKMDRRGALGLGLVLGGGVGATALMGASGEAEAASPFRLKAHTDGITALVISPDGRTLASSAKDRTPRLWSLRDGKMLVRLNRNVRSEKTLLISPDSKVLAYSPEDPTIRLRALPSGKALATLKGHTGTVTALAISPDSRVLVSGSKDGTIKLWSLPAGKQLATFRLDAGYANALAISSDGSALASGSDRGTLYLWSMTDRKQTAALAGHRRGIDAIVIAPNGQLMVSSSTNDRALVWKLPNAKNVFNFVYKGGKLGNFTISSDSRLVAYSLGTQRDGLRVYSMYKLKTLASLGLHSAPISSLVLSHDDKTVATGSLDKSISLRTLPDGRSKTVLKGHRRPVTTLAIDPTGETLASGDSGGTIILWRLKDGDVISSLFDPFANRRNVKAVTYKVRTGTRTISYSQPCGSPIPPGAVCTCNCVAGTAGRHISKPKRRLSAPKKRATRPKRRPRRSTGGSRFICTCNKVCTCVPVCQAHRLLHPDPAVRVLAEQILLIMGRGELNYMNWAAQEAEADLGPAIGSIIERIENGERWNAANWPRPETCAPYLNADDKVTALMAAQMLSQWWVNGHTHLRSALAGRVSALSEQGQSMHWKRQASGSRSRPPKFHPS